MSKHLVAAFAAISTIVPAGVLQSAPQAEVPRWTEADTAALDASLAALEDRLLTDQARVRFWQEMKTRHEDVTAVACTNLGEHASAMTQAQARTGAKVADQKRRRVAAAYELRD